MSDNRPIEILEDKIHNLIKKVEELELQNSKLQDQLLGLSEVDLTARQACAALLKQFIAKKFNYTLLYPSVIIRKLPKPEKFGSLFLPEAYRNKPNHEAVVMQTWEKRTVKTSRGEVVLTPTFKPGDIVMYHFWAGQPIPNFGDDECVEWMILPDRNIFNKPGALDDPAPYILVDTEKPNPRTKLIEMISVWHDDAVKPEIIADELQKEFDIVVKQTVSLSDYMEPTRPD